MTAFDSIDGTKAHGTNAEECAFLLRKWADVLVIPSGPFVNEDLRRAADELDRLRAELDRANSPLWHDPKYGLVND